ncbi:class I adenylate-forming enzyme family protein [Phenylobacterium sp.]|uniref:class I adenylate-forming enzyme family protein n=1 Tax=Phenylobacterium sp. TaxID=1871053 RepID=UPI0037C9BEB9
MADTPTPKYATRAEAIAALTAPGQFYELEQMMIRGRSLRVFKNAPASLRELFADAVSDKTFIVYETDRLTFAEAWAKAGRIGGLLVKDYGVQPGDRVAISMRNYPEWILAFMAVTSIGAIAVAMNALWQPDEMAYGLSDSGAKVLFADQERLDRLAQVAKPVDVKVIAVRATESVGSADLNTLLAAAGDVDMPPASIAPDDDAMIFYTSGSTGHPKGVISTHRNVLSALFSWELDLVVGAELAGIAPEPPVVQPAGLLAVPLFHVTGANAIFLQAYRAQRKLVCMYRWDPERAAELIEVEKISSFTAPAAMTGDLVRAARLTSRDLSSLLTVGGGGAPRAPEQVKQIEGAFGKALPNTGWGMTETNAIGTGIGGPDYLERPASSGRCSAVLDLKIVDEQGHSLPASERGELLVRGTSVFFGYWNRPDVNANLFEDGWFRTGDLAYLDDEGFLFIVDRIKDLIIRGGENIGCGQVEAALLLHPDVHEAAVYAVPDERLGEEVGATVHGAPGLDPEALRTFLQAHLARFEVPRYILLADQPLPRTASGKILKRDLREAALKDLGVAAG